MLSPASMGLVLGWMRPARAPHTQWQILCRDILALLCGVRAACLLDAEHGRAAADPSVVLGWLASGRASSPGLAAALEPLSLMGILTRGSPACVELEPEAELAAAEEKWEAVGGRGSRDGTPVGTGYDALFVVHRGQLAAQCRDALGVEACTEPVPFCVVDAGARIGTAGTASSGKLQLSAATVCDDPSVARALLAGVTAVGEALATHDATPSQDAILEVLLPTVTDVTASTAEAPSVPQMTLSGWLLGYPVGYYCAPSQGGNNLGGQPLTLYSLVAEPYLGSSPNRGSDGGDEDDWAALWSALAAPAVVLYSFSVPCALLDANSMCGGRSKAALAVEYWATAWRERTCGAEPRRQIRGGASETAMMPWHVRCESTVVTLEQVAL